MILDETRARELQARYLEGDQDALGGLYLEIRSIARKWAAIILSAKHLPVSKQKLDIISHDAATKIILLYLKNSDYSIYSFYERVRLEVMKALFHKNLRKDEQTEDIEALRIPYVARETRKHNDAMQSVMTECPQGNRVVLDLAGSRWYKEAINKISAYVSRPWIYDHAVELHTLYRMTRCPKRKLSR
ncbi:MAG: hypothetical protein WC455_16100 [Dehalococcoidia bacterium]|jgi:hypothetical protein